MPRVLNHTPSWLCHPSPGFDLFHLPSTKPQRKNGTTSGGKTKDSQDVMSRRRIAQRGTEVFVAVGNELRWSDLVLLRDRKQELDSRVGRRGSSAYGASSQGGDEVYYRVLEHNVYGDIRQLIISPRGDYLAIITLHTVHILYLPSSEHLNSPDLRLKPKCYQVGPTDHVLEGSPLALVLWHPLGHKGSCLVTVTTSAVVRLFELNPGAKNATFDTPTLAIDLKRLANATSREDAVRQQSFRESIGYSPDLVDMEAVSATFSNATTGWAAMTLWVAMKGGDVYALCPLLPKKWQASPSLMKSLSIAITAKDGSDSEEDEEDESEEEARATTMQIDWYADLCDQEHTLDYPPNATDPSPNQVFTCPVEPGMIPKLQGPFYLEPEIEDLSEVTDLLVLGLKSSDPTPSEYDDFDVETEEYLPYSLVCLLTASGQVHVCIDVDGVEGQWLSKEKTRPLSLVQGSELPELLLFDTVDLPGIIKNRPCHPTFVRDLISPSTFFITHNAGVCGVSLAKSIQKLLAEFNAPGEAGAGVRLDVLLEGEKSRVDLLINIVDEHPDFFHGHIPDLSVDNCLIFEDSDLPGFLLTACHGQPFAASLELPLDSETADAFDDEDDAEHKVMVPAESRPTYRPADAFEKPITLEKHIENSVQPRHRRLLKEQDIVFSPATLSIMTECHLVLSQETNIRNLAAADLFRRCERDRDELMDQVKRVRGLSDKVDEITGDDEEPESGDEDSQQSEQERVVGAAKIQRRIEDADARQKDLVKRYHSLFQKVERLQVRELTEQERAWAEELKRMDKATTEGGEPGDKDSSMPPWRRIKDARNLKDELIPSAKAVMKEGEARGDSPHRVPAEYRKAKVAQVNELLDRETALVEATTARLGRLTMDV